MSSNFVRFQEILDKAFAENIICLTQKLVNPLTLHFLFLNIFFSASSSDGYKFNVFNQGQFFNLELSSMQQLLQIGNSWLLILIKSSSLIFTNTIKIKRFNLQLVSCMASNLKPIWLMKSISRPEPGWSTIEKPFDFWYLPSNFPILC